MEDSPIHHFDPYTYHVPCGDGDKIFGEGHGGSIYESEVTCKKCKALLAKEKDERSEKCTSM